MYVGVSFCDVQNSEFHPVTAPTRIEIDDVMRSHAPAMEATTCMSGCLVADPKNVFLGGHLAPYQSVAAIYGSVFAGD